MPFYFAYGSNMDVERLETARLNPEGIRSTRRTAGRLTGYRLTFNKPSAYFIGAGAANLEASAGAHVYGTLNEMPEAGLEILDRYENVALGQYERVSVQVEELVSGQLVDAVAYIAFNNIDDTMKPRSGYMNHLLAGRDILPADWIAYLNSIPLIAE
ncbi:gamma-glutamylcyclotransferase family protein [Rhizobium sp. FKY42]|uniref:gamma-glutamylcyclotransferase family protein n=1 Tax=Rhizobium sp. FKY42 TaxID=2562310 RepID=UPI0010BFED44|nr:gamma-glutamylcyclotransferase family protein [Rhizobium sp. FKY42]